MLEKPCMYFIFSSLSWLGNMLFHASCWYLGVDFIPFIVIDLLSVLVCFILMIIYLSTDLMHCLTRNSFFRFIFSFPDLFSKSTWKKLKWRVYVINGEGLGFPSLLLIGKIKEILHALLVIWRLFHKMCWDYEVCLYALWYKKAKCY